MTDGRHIETEVLQILVKALEHLRKQTTGDFPRTYTLHPFAATASLFPVVSNPRGN